MSTKKEKWQKDITEFSKRLLPGVGGTTIGTIIGVLSAGTVGAIGGAIIGSVVEATFTDIQERYLSQREKSRVDQCTRYALLKIQERLEAGHTLRSGDFFTKDPTGRSPAEEIFETALLIAICKWVRSDSRNAETTPEYRAR